MARRAFVLLLASAERYIDDVNPDVMAATIEKLIGG